jgi:hypothetical protein
LFVLFNFFKVSVFANVWVEMGRFVPILLGILPSLLHDIVHALLQFLHPPPEYPFDNQFKSVENEYDDE